MSYYDKVDLAFSNDGDFILDETGDLALSQDFMCTADDIKVVTKTSQGDSECYPTMGANLEELVGQPNTRSVGEDGASRIASALTGSNIVSSTDLNVVPIPVKETIMYYIMVDQATGTKMVEHNLNLSDSTGGG